MSYAEQPHFSADFSAGNRGESPSHTLRGMNTNLCLRPEERGDVCI